MSDSARPHRWQPNRLLCPWDSPGKNSGMGCHFLLPRIFPTQGESPCLWHRWVDFLPLCHQRDDQVIRQKLQLVKFAKGTLVFTHFLPVCYLYLSSLAHSAKHLTLLLPTLLFPRPFWQYSHWTLENNELTLLLFKFSLIVPLTIWLSFSISLTQIICVTLHSSVLLCQLQTTVLPTSHFQLLAINFSTNSYFYIYSHPNNPTPQTWQV